MAALAGLLVAMNLSACGPSPSPHCTGGTENYQGRCMPPVMVNYLGCIQTLGFNRSTEVGGAVTLPELAGVTVQLAYKQSKQVADTAALEMVRSCLVTAEQKAPSPADQGAVRQSVRQAAQDTRVIDQKLPKIELNPSETLDCGSVALGALMKCQVTIKSTGVAALFISRAEVTGTNSSDFAVGSECSGRSLTPGENCVMNVQFQPTAAGPREATLIIHQNLPSPDHGTALQLKGTGTGTTPPVTHTLTVALDTSGSLSHVTSSPTGIVCPGQCSATFPDGTDVTLTAVSDQGSGSVTWAGGCNPGTSNSCTIHLSADSTVSAKITPVAG